MSFARPISAALLAAATATVACQRDTDREPEMQPASRFTPPPEPPSTASPGPGVTLPGTSGARPPESVGRPGEMAPDTWGTNEPDMNSGSPPRVDTRDAAILALSGARCDLAYRCQQIGIDRKYQNRDLCESAMNKENSADLAGDDCVAGVDGGRLDSCVQMIKQHSCDASMKDLDDVPACDSDVLCKR
jgi:hypothetical protein